MTPGQTIAGPGPSPVHTSKRGRPPRDAALRLSTHILETAFDHFVRDGIEGANMDLIAQAASVSKRTLYMRYGSKKGLLVAVLEHGLASNLDPIIADMPAADTREKILYVAGKLLTASLMPKAIRLEHLLRDIAEHDRGITIRNSPLNAEPFIDIFRALLMSDPDLREQDSDTLGFLAALLFDALVTSPRARVRDRQDLDSDPGALVRFQERTLDVITQGVPLLRKAG